VTAHPERAAPAIRALGALATGLERVSGISGRLRPPVVPVERALALVVEDVTCAAEGVVSLRLIRPDRGDLPPWRPGAHVDVGLPSGRVRQYSLCGEPANRHVYRIAVRRIADGGGSREVHDLQRGAVVTVRGPRNAFAFIPVDKYLFVAGGIGITPLRPMISDAIGRGADWRLVYTGRTRASMPFLDELAALDAERVHIRPDDEFGAPDGKRIVGQAPHGAALYCCGPPPMIAAIRAELPAERVATLHYERFSPAPVVGGRPFDLELARSGEVLAVGAGQTALDAVRAVRPGIAYSCQQGFCGTCPVALIGGAVDHRDRCLTDVQRESRFALCVSRGTGRVRVDL
jgi:ferredoxin-NADP reductase